MDKKAELQAALDAANKRLEEARAQGDVGALAAAEAEKKNIEAEIAAFPPPEGPKAPECGQRGSEEDERSVDDRIKAAVDAAMAEFLGKIEAAQTAVQTAAQTSVKEIGDKAAEHLGKIEAAQTAVQTAAQTSVKEIGDKTAESLGKIEAADGNMKGEIERAMSDFLNEAKETKERIGASDIESDVAAAKILATDAKARMDEVGENFKAAKSDLDTHCKRVDHVLDSLCERVDHVLDSLNGRREEFEDAQHLYRVLQKTLRKLGGTQIKDLVIGLANAVDKTPDASGIEDLKCRLVVIEQRQSAPVAQDTTSEVEDIKHRLSVIEQWMRAVQQQSHTQHSPSAVDPTLVVFDALERVAKNLEAAAKAESLKSRFTPPVKAVEAVTSAVQDAANSLRRGGGKKS